MRFGDLQIIPVGDGLIYVRPVLRVGAAERLDDRGDRVPVGDRDRTTTGRCSNRTLSEALAVLFPGFEGDLNDRVDQPTEPTAMMHRRPTTPSRHGEDTPTDEVEPGTALDAAQLLEQADALFLEADEALQADDLGTYQDKIDEARGARSPRPSSSSKAPDPTADRSGGSGAGGIVRRVRRGPGGTGSDSGPARRPAVRRSSCIGSMSLPISFSWLASSVETDVTRVSRSSIR